jgi:hypothetical protein
MKNKKLRKRTKKVSKTQTYISKALFVLTGALAGFVIAGPLAAGVGALAGIISSHLISK